MLRERLLNILNTSMLTNPKIEGYRKTLKKFGPTAKALQWKDQKVAEIRYWELIVDLDFEGKSILDVGCGFGDIISFISQKTKTFDYTGIDLVPEFIEIAKERFPQRKFLLGDYFGYPGTEDFDIVMTSGTLNSNIPNAFEYRMKAIRTMYEHARYACAFNMAGGHPKPVNGRRVAYMDSLEVVTQCFNLTSKIIFRNQYHKKDFTVTLYK